MIKTVLFDLWDTLASKKRLIFEDLQHRYALPEEMFNFYVEQLLKLEVAEINEAQFWHNLRVESHVDGLDEHPQLVNIYNEITIVNTELLDSALAFKARGGRIALFSNTDPAAKDYLHKAGILGKFDESFFSFDYQLLKPDPQFLDQVLSKLCVDPREVAYFDDNPKCIKTALDAGVHGFVYEDLAEATSILREYTQDLTIRS
jgi:HAD superfamily hydrolase (TIGR01509 family)